MENQASSVGDGGSGFVHAFKTAMELGGEDLIPHLVDIDDGTRDGNDRTVNQDGEPSAGVDMRDFRRFRDWLLQAEDDAALKLDGPADHVKRDLNRDTVVDTAAKENVYPRGDFNGDGSLSRMASVDLPHVGTVTDLNMLERLFSDERYTVDRLPALLDSGDLELNATPCLDEPEIESLRITVTPAGGGTATEMRDHQLGTELQIYTLPMGSYTVTADALASDGSVVSTEDRPIDVGLGEDLAWQPRCGAGVAGGLAVGARHTCALSVGGDTYCWGSNTHGQLGDGTMASPGMPVGVIGLTAAKSLGASGAHSCAVRADETVVCWGANDVGQLGNGGMINTTEPVAVAGLTDVVSVGAGGSDSGTGFSCALDRSGDVWCWGANLAGQLAGSECASVCVPGTEAWSMTGNPAKQACLDCRNARQGQATPRRSSVAGATALSLGLRHACAIVGSGMVLCWGSNAEGQLGVRGQEAGPMLTTDDPMPVCLSWDETAMPPCLQTMDDAISVSAGNVHTCAVLRDGTAMCWGFQGSDGRLGDDSRLVQLIPATVMNVTGATKIAAGGNHSCAVTGSGEAYCWGWNATGTLGDGTNINSTLAVQVLGLDDATTIDVGDQHSCALRTDAPLVCWGRHGAGPNNFEPVEIPLR
jgi:alpha-tubulin suppressor-like RCC1 family protein